MIDRSIRAVFFDAVGTLILPKNPVSQTYTEFAQRYGIDLSGKDVAARFRDAFARQEERDSLDEWRTDEARERDRWRIIVSEALGERDCDECFSDLWNWYSQPAAWSVNSDAGTIVQTLLRRDLIVGIGSNFDSRLPGLIAGIADLSPLGDRCIVSSIVGWRKPAREFFIAIIKNASCPAEQILYVGDDLRNDVHGATAAGLKAVLFDPNGHAESGPRIRFLRDLLSP